MVNKRTVINVISGKGGTGKTLLTAVIAEMLGNEGARVLVVDLDIFVRGLTALLYFHKNESLVVTEKHEIPVSSFFKYKGSLPSHSYPGKKSNSSTTPSAHRKVSISRYRSFDVLPSVAYVNQLLDFRDMMPCSLEEASRIISSLLENIPNHYDFIFLDSRAGYDELIAASHEISDFSICVEEDDDISMITTDNLIEQLRSDNKSKNLFRLKNKVRSDKQTFSPVSNGITFLGSIPFDTDVLNSFGTKGFWADINKSIYYEAVKNVWNTLSKKMSLGIVLQEQRISPLGSGKFEKKLSLLSINKRILFLYGSFISGFCLLYFIFRNETLYVNGFNPDIGILLISLSGLLLSVFSIFLNNRR